MVVTIIIQDPRRHVGFLRKNKDFVNGYLYCMWNLTIVISGIIEVADMQDLWDL